jgi:hypothetical protein
MNGCIIPKRKRTNCRNTTLARLLPVGRYTGSLNYTTSIKGKSLWVKEGKGIYPSPPISLEVSHRRYFPTETQYFVGRHNGLFVNTVNTCCY